MLRSLALRSPVQPVRLAVARLSTAKSGSIGGYAEEQEEADRKAREEHFGNPWTEDEEATRRMVLDGALALVHEQGWSSEALATSAQQLGFSAVTHGMFPRGGMDLILYFMRDASRATALRLAEMDRDGMASADIIRTGLRLRLHAITPYMSTWPAAMAQGALPLNALDTANELALFMDELCHQAGDDSVGIDWYAKRAAVGAVYTSTELYMLTDRSLDFMDSWDFMDRQLDRLQMVEAGGTQAQDVLWAAAAGAKSLLSSVPSLFAGGMSSGAPWPSPPSPPPASPPASPPSPTKTTV
eukprot:PLAT1277.1.p1 GENE.PLAT1277.1~~PLAT1277.1.p1  ORF type:complete len:309 (-),score=85.49 PLAT1277.1:73-969(-)